MSLSLWLNDECMANSPLFPEQHGKHRVGVADLDAEHGTTKPVMTHYQDFASLLPIGQGTRRILRHIQPTNMVARKAEWLAD